MNFLNQTQMQAILGALVAVSSFGAAYVSHMVFPVKPISDADVLLSQSTIGTVNIYSKEELVQQGKSARELIDVYLQRKANLQDVLEVVTGKDSLKEAYAHLATMEQTPEIQYLARAARENYKLE